VSEGATGSGEPPRPGLLDPTDLARLASLDLRARTIVEGAFSGMHRNLHPGTSVEFTEHREYAPGDEIRRIDWKAVGRADRYYVKRFEDETEMHTFLVLDASASMGYRRRGVSKLDYAGYLAGALAYLVGSRAMPPGCCSSTRVRAASCRPRPGRTNPRGLPLLEAAQPAGRTDAALALGHLGELIDQTQSHHCHV